MIAKATASAADEVVLDLEDAVAVHEKERALQTVLDALESWSGPHPSVRVNGLHTPWCHSELVSLARCRLRPLSVVVPKVESAGDLLAVERILSEAELSADSSAPLGIIALIETAAGLSAVSEIAATSPRLQGLILGYADLAADLGRSASGPDDLNLWLPTQERLLVAARTNRIQAIDGPFLGIAEDESFRNAARRAQELGFDGKWAIHPAQVETLMRMFTPTDEAVTYAQTVIRTLDRAGSESGAGAVALNGQMLDEASRRAALRIIARSGATK